MLEIAPAFAVSVRREGECAVLVLEGEFDYGVEEQARAALESTRDARVLVIDLRELTFMDSSGVHLLLDTRDECRASGRMLLVVPGPDRVQRGLSALDLESGFEFVNAP